MRRGISAWCAIAALATSVCVAQAEHVSNPKASLIDIAGRRTTLQHTHDPRTKQAIASLSFCSK
ncbi:MAG TPA: hypothetical protein VFS41_12120, partial [Edaphobacter sp.]|nr:hypothetical protein [Edaphobacter sp.]